MQYVIKEKFWSFGDDFHIYTPDRSPVFFIDGQAFTWGDNLSFQDMNGNELAFISQKLFSWKPRYEIYRNGNLFAEVTKEWSWFNKQFTLDIPGPNDYVIDGNFWRHDYKFDRDGTTVAVVRKTFWSWADTYGVDVIDGEDDVAILCTAIVIDQILHDEKKN